MKVWHVTMTLLYFSDLMKKKSQSGNQALMISVPPFAEIINFLALLTEEHRQSEVTPS